MPLNVMLLGLRAGHVIRVSCPADFDYCLSEKFGLSTLAAMSSREQDGLSSANPAFGGGEE